MPILLAESPGSTVLDHAEGASLTHLSATVILFCEKVLATSCLNINYA